MESELVSGFMTEHSAVIFVFFFLAEYASIVLICVLISLLYLGGYNLDYTVLVYIIESVFYLLTLILDQTIYTIKGILLIMLNLGEDLNMSDWLFLFRYINVPLNYDFEVEEFFEDLLSEPVTENMLYSLIIALKSFFMIFIFIWARASFPRIRFDQLMSYCWTILLPLVFAFIVLVPCVLYAFEMVPSNALFY